MSTITRKTSTTTSATSPAVTFRHVDAATVVIADNIRHDVTLDDAFLASVRDSGVLTPVTLTEAADGTLTVRVGQRRTLAAAKVGVPLPAVIMPDEDDAAARVVEQLAENDHRAEVTDRDRVAAYEQLAGFGLTAEQIETRTNRPRAEVEAALTVAASKTATKATARWDWLTLEGAAAVAEFEDDTADVERIVVAAKEGDSIAHVAQRIRDDRDRAAALAALHADLTEQGVPVIERPAYDDRKVTDLWSLRATPDDTTPLDEATHQTCPGHAAYISSGYSGPRPVYVCTDPRAHGHHKPGGAAVAGPMTEEEKQARREVIENNKAWDAAETVRGEWIAAWATGTTAPKGVETFLAVAIAHGETNTQGTHVGRERASVTKTLSKAAPRTALRHAAGLLLSSWHAKSGRHTWRTPSEQDRRYLAAMIAWGYEAAEIEQATVKGK